MSTIVPNAALLPPGAVTAPGQAAPPGSSPAPASTGPSFASLLAEQTSVAQTPKFSKHALDRLAQRGVEVDGTTLDRLTDGIQRAAGKGSRNSVVFVDGTAFVASVKNNTVITAVPEEHMQSQVFTNIDSAVIA